MPKKRKSQNRTRTIDKREKVTAVVTNDSIDSAVEPDKSSCEETLPIALTNPSNLTSSEKNSVPTSTASPPVIHIEEDFKDKDSLSESELEDQHYQKSRDKNNDGTEWLQERCQHGRKYQKLNHLDEIIEPLSDSTFVSSTRMSKSSVTSSSSLFDDWDNWKSDDHDGDMQDKTSPNNQTLTTTSVGKLMKQRFSKETISQDSVISSEDIVPHEVSAAIVNVLRSENLEDMIRTAINREVEKHVKSFFNNHADFISLPPSSSHLSSFASQKRKYRDQNHVITTVMEFTKPLFMKMRNLSDTTLELIINTMWPEKPTFEDESDINTARGKAKKFFQAYRCNLNNDLSQHADIMIERYQKKKNASRIRTFTKSIIVEYVTDDFARCIFNTYLIYAPTMKDDTDALDILKSFLYRALSFHIGEKLNGNGDHEGTLNKIKGLDHITKDLVLKSRFYANVINNI